MLPAHPSNSPPPSRHKPPACDSRGVALPPCSARFSYLQVAWVEIGRFCVFLCYRKIAVSSLAFVEIFTNGVGDKQDQRRGLKNIKSRLCQSQFAHAIFVQKCIFSRGCYQRTLSNSPAALETQASCLRLEGCCATSV